MNPPSSLPFWCVVPAAGVGSRMRADRPKQYLTLSGRTILEHTLARLLAQPGLQRVVVSLSSDDPYWPHVAQAADERVWTAPGGKERADSVLSALDRLVAAGVNEHAWVLVHDAARPNLAPEDLARLLATLADDPVGGLLAGPSRDTLKLIGPDGRVVQTLDRAAIWQAYTPQMFRLGLLRAALSDALAACTQVTDEASAMERLGYSPRLVEGRTDNIKVTRPEDLEWLQRAWGDPL
ncbi:2-C-methyl-D-erythritol 4-phosphate cytidylyltransferase [Stutzerimonas urumqiensis]|uniref:2-C-methyl-D-erythritol 4-phosphate cytidylyltransferase n=1 Tax=Stutzerimonas urumqiensis TaxID=638269 RepID=UPI000EB4119F|nr:2-C-methyl-D-erythritol 4-phosphate cytidylyltransferase [Stutzerimonas urumqiensis]